MTDAATRKPSRLEAALLLLLLAVMIAFGGLVELRTAYLSRRMGDLDCFLRTAWAVRAGEDIYDVVENNGFHYNYPPLYAILMTPLADPPAGYDRAGYIPFPVAVFLAYLLNAGCAVLAVHLLASALEKNTTNPAYRAQPKFCRRWWALRFVPFAVCLPPIGNSAMKGQVNLQILLLLSLWIYCLAVNRRGWAGFFLAVAACIKVIPVYLFVYPLWRRDGRQLAGGLLGLVLGLALIPGAVFGPARTVAVYQKYATVFFGPLLNLNDDHSRHDELIGVNGTDAVGVKNAIHNWLNPDKFSRPEHSHPLELLAWVVLGAGMTLAVLWRRGGGRGESWSLNHELGCLVLLMIALAPISHVHYYALCLPVVVSLLFRRWEGRADLLVDVPLFLALAGFLVANSLPSLPPLQVLKDRCLPLFGALPLWGLCVFQLWRRSGKVGTEGERGDARLAA